MSDAPSKGAREEHKVVKKNTKTAGVGKKKEKAKAARDKMMHKKLRESQQIYRSCIMKLFVKDIFKQTMQDEPELILCEKITEETSKKIQEAIQLLWDRQLGMNSVTEEANAAVEDISY